MLLGNGDEGVPAALGVGGECKEGEADKLFPVKAAGEVMQGLIPGATLEVVKASGHEPMVETPAAFMEAFRRALAS